MKRLILLAILLVITSAVFAQEAETGSYEIGDTGPGGGMVFYINGDTYLECSDNLGEVNKRGGSTLAEDYRGGGYDDWYLPNKDELNYIYENLRVAGFISDDNWYWSSTWSYGSNYWSQWFSEGSQVYDMQSSGGVRAVRLFTSVAGGNDITYWLMDPYRTTDNLRLRAEEGLAGEALFTLSKDTLVKIIELGNKETIDGITANWVQIEVQDDTLSIQGDTIKSGALGWCFGGYLDKYKIGDSGPAGGIVFYMGVDTYLECSDDLGEIILGEDSIDYQGGGYDDWYLPDTTELNYIYENLAVKGFIEASGVYWRSVPYYEDNGWQRFSDGSLGLSGVWDKVSHNVRLIRSFYP